MDVLNNTYNAIDNFTTPLPTIIKAIGFSWYDYVFFCAILAVSVLVGIYFGCFGSKQSTANEYLLGGKQMNVIPVAISLVASHTSGITLLAVPADVYKYGAGYWLGVISFTMVAIITIYVFLPIFYDLQITSTYEYLERRFNKRTREFASILFAISLFVYLPIVIYVPALAFSAATGLNIHLIAPVVCGVCIFYTTIGGLKAVVWTDTLQFVVTMGAMMAVFVLGLMSVGGISNVWSKSIEGHRLDIFDFDPDPTKRDSFWIICVGLTVHWVAQTSVNQSCIQKFLSVPTLRKAKQTVICYGIGYCSVKTICVVSGLIMYTRYANCDPFTTKTIERNDQLIPYYIMDVAGNVPGLSGLFTAGVFSSALSTLSANLNCVAGTIYEDFVTKFMKEHTGNSSSRILKLIVIITGIISTALVLVFEHLGGILQLSISIGGIVHGPLLGLFTLGALIPVANSKGSIYGGTIGVFSVGTLWAVSKYYEEHGLGYPSKPISIEGCSPAFNLTLDVLNSTLAEKTTSARNKQFFLFRISYYYNTLLGALITVLAGTIISYVKRSENKQPVDRKLLSPVIHRFLPEESEKKYYTIDKALHIITRNVDKDGKVDYSE